MDKNQNGVDDRAEMFTAMIGSSSPVILFLVSVGCLALNIFMPNMSEAATKATNETRTMSFGAALSLINNTFRRKENKE